MIYRGSRLSKIPKLISDLANPDPLARNGALVLLFLTGRDLTKSTIGLWNTHPEFSSLLLRDAASIEPDDFKMLSATVGIATSPKNFQRIRKEHGSPRLSDVPPDQDALEFELHSATEVGPPLRLDILTTKEPDGEGAIAKYLKKFGEGIQQVEYEVSNVDRATQLITETFGLKSIYPSTRPGANGTRINFFLVPTEDGKKILIELVEPAR
jgi:hypothetical protein